MARSAHRLARRWRGPRPLRRRTRRRNWSCQGRFPPRAPCFSWLKSSLFCLWRKDGFDVHLGLDDHIAVAGQTATVNPGNDAGPSRRPRQWLVEARIELIPLGAHLLIADVGQDVEDRLLYVDLDVFGRLDPPDVGQQVRQRDDQRTFL